MTSTERRSSLSRAIARTTFAFGLTLFSTSGLSAQATSNAAHAGASTTRVMVHVLAHDAKLVGSNVGGALVTVTDVATGRVLAQGRHDGGTGDTRRIMSEPHQRGEPLFDTQGAAGFLAELAIQMPTVVEITATGPGAPDNATMRASTTLLVVPGHDITGDGVVLELHGFRVEMLEPGVPAASAGKPFTTTARVTMMCGCPTQPGGMWNADHIQILARLLDGDRVLAETPLAFTGTTSQYSGSITPTTAGSFTLEVLAIDAANANAGRAHRDLVVR